MGTARKKDLLEVGTSLGLKVSEELTVDELRKLISRHAKNTLDQSGDNEEDDRVSPEEWARCAFQRFLEDACFSEEAFCKAAAKKLEEDWKEALFRTAGDYVVDNDWSKDVPDEDEEEHRIVTLSNLMLQHTRRALLGVGSNMLEFRQSCYAMQAKINKEAECNIESEDFYDSSQQEDFDDCNYKKGSNKKRKGSRLVLPTEQLPTTATKRRRILEEQGSDDESPYLRNSRHDKATAHEGGDHIAKLVNLLGKQIAKQSALTIVKDLRIPKFTREKGLQSGGFPWWYKDFLAACKARNFNDEQLLAHLRSPHYTAQDVWDGWWEQFHHQGNLTRVLAELNRHYRDQGATEEDRVAFNKFKQGELTALQYESKKKALYLKAYPMNWFSEEAETRDITEEEVFVQSFLAGFGEEVRNRLAKKEGKQPGIPLTYKQIVETAEVCERVRESLRRMPSIPDEKKPKKTKETSSSDRNKKRKDTVCSAFLKGECKRGKDCWFSHEVKAPKKDRSEEHKRAQQECQRKHEKNVAAHPYHACVDPSVKCFYCSGKGHTKYQCPKAKCSTCGGAHLTVAHGWSKTSSLDF